MKRPIGSMLGGHVFWSALVIVLCVTSFWVLKKEYSRTGMCDTTYINPRYKEMKFLPMEVKSRFAEYKLFKYEEEESFWVPDSVVREVKKKGSYVVLFAHGHMGTFEQFRSMASETAKEIVRRIKSGDNKVDWIDWYSADFNEEPSGLEQRILKRQAAFLKHCIEYLSSFSKSKKVILVGYSMGGLVVDKAMLLSGTLVDFALTLGSPHFMLPEFTFHGLPNPAGKIEYSENEPPMFRIYSGPGDFMVLALSAWSSYRSINFNKPNLIEVDMDDIPGVWLTASHKGIVSCNQLVRQVVPLIIDGVKYSGSVDSKEKIFDFGKQRLLSRFYLGSRAMEKIKFGWDEYAARGGDIQKKIEAFGGFQKCFSPQVENVYQIVSPRDTSLCYSVRKNGNMSNVVQVSIAGMQPGKDFWLLGKSGDTILDVSDIMTPLPSTFIEEPTRNRRFWMEVIRGINWKQNATWITELTLLNSTDLNMDALAIFFSGKSTVGEQNILSIARSPIDQHSDLNSRKSLFISLDPEELMERQLERISRPYIRELLHKAWGLVPWAISVTRTSCSGCQTNGKILCPGKPVLLALSKSENSSDTIKRDVEEGSALVASLWHPAISQRKLVAVVDPRCSYDFRLSVDFMQFSTYAIRYQIYALPGVLLSLILIGIIKIRRGSTGLWIVQRVYSKYMTTFILLTSFLLVFSFSWVEKAFGTLKYSLQVGQSPLEYMIFLLFSTYLGLVISYFMASILNGMERLWVKVPCKSRTNEVHWRWLAAAVVLYILHDFAPFVLLVGYILKMCLLNLEPKYGNTFSLAEWMLILLFGCAPMAVSMFGGNLLTYRHRECYGFGTIERSLLVLISLSTIEALRPRENKRSIHCWPSRVSVMILGEVAVLASLWGFNYVPSIIVLLVGIATSI